MSNIAAWKKNEGTDKEHISISVDIPFLGKETFILFPNKNKKSENSPDYTGIVSRPMKKDNQGPGDIPF